MPAGGLEHVNRPEQVDLGVEVRPLDGNAHVHLRGEMEADLRTGVCEDSRGSGEVGLDQPGAFVDVLVAARGEVVEDGDVVPTRDERIYNVRADEARSPCHDRPHGALS